MFQKISYFSNIYIPNRNSKNNAEMKENVISNVMVQLNPHKEDLNYYDNAGIYSNNTQPKIKPIINPYLIDEYLKEIKERNKINNDRATMIIPAFLYLGGHRSIKNINELFEQKITHILNMAIELKFDLEQLKYMSNLKVMSINAHDGKNYNIRLDFEKAFDFIDDAFKTRGRIIVNCARGISRSATIVIGYLMYKYKMRLSEAYDLLTRLRPQVRPNSSFRYQLELYEQELISNRYFNTNLVSVVASSNIKK